ncbi:hypothetical protein PoMZ_06927 [Pyricularia oryzae]|uniref:Uncharacterized protein n=1 Tax=Pyricularia oryzae TaxID=318829 RepID=A0A4P7NS95_PYROR|nr:hypothetical protein PoMZ_06927 [Pyricularia oryzae]
MFWEEELVSSGSTARLLVLQGPEGCQSSCDGAAPFQACLFNVLSTSKSPAVGRADDGVAGWSLAS